MIYSAFYSIIIIIMSIFWGRELWADGRKQLDRKNRRATDRLDRGVGRARRKQAVSWGRDRRRTGDGTTNCTFLHCTQQLYTSNMPLSVSVSVSYMLMSMSPLSVLFLFLHTHVFFCTHYLFLHSLCSLYNSLLFSSHSFSSSPFPGRQWWWWWWGHALPAEAEGQAVAGFVLALLCNICSLAAYLCMACICIYVYVLLCMCLTVSLCSSLACLMSCLHMLILCVSPVYVSLSHHPPQVSFI